MEKRHEKGEGKSLPARSSFTVTMAKTIVVQHHVLVPQHVVMSEDDVNQLLAKYNISRKQMPGISAKDPAIKEMTVKSGDVIKILRNSPTQGKSEFYRVVKE